MRKQIFEELKAQMQNNQQVIDEKKTNAIIKNLQQSYFQKTV